MSKVSKVSKCLKCLGCVWLVFLSYPTSESQITRSPSLQYHTKVNCVIYRIWYVLPSYSVGGVVILKLGPKYLAGLTSFSLFCRLNLTLLFDLGMFGVLSMDFVLGVWGVLGVCVLGVCVCVFYVCVFRWNW